MKFKDYYKPIWLLNLKDRNLSQFPPSRFSVNEQIDALSYLEKINADFEKFAEIYFKHIKKTPEVEKTLANIRGLSMWIALAKTLLNSLR